MGQQSSEIQEENENEDTVDALTAASNAAEGQSMDAVTKLRASGHGRHLAHPIHLPSKILDAEGCIGHIRHSVKFQRIVINGAAMGVLPEDLLEDAHRLVGALKLREFYMARSLQSFCKTTSKFLETTSDGRCLDVAHLIKESERKTNSGPGIYHS